MSTNVPFLLLPGLLGSPRLYQEQIFSLWRLGEVFISNTSLDPSIEGIAKRVLSCAPPRFNLVGLSMGGYIAFEIIRQAAERVEKLILLDTTARADTPEISASRRSIIGLAENGGFSDIVNSAYSAGVHPSRVNDHLLKETVLKMAHDVGEAGFVRQLHAIIGRPDSRQLLKGINCETLILVGDTDRLTPKEHSEEMAGEIKKSTLIIVPECGHISTLEQPLFVNNAITSWLKAR
ncbi:alpha/beta hydrolase [Brenneria izadpanahii]|uniref:Alpha/beta hydrolase n=1 Tax=Brenneria izadpanahii TaxID=2722756 RepID=A0ABX7UYI7_9GAMM|nr:alpha/beta hydrolase [Brenneria izadpanahii]QTF08614.1 alpha/beta hydrolase [Brenneria izadpanahii]